MKWPSDCSGVCMTNNKVFPIQPHLHYELLHGRVLSMFNFLASEA